MKLRFLGSTYRPYGSKKADGFSPALLIDRTMLIDPMEDIFRFAELYAMNDLYDEVDTVVVTHTHPAHASPDVLARLCRKRPIRLYGSEATLAMFSHVEGLSLLPLFPFRTVAIGRYRLTPLSTRHTTATLCEIPLNLRIACDGHALFYALDGGVLTEDTQRYLSQYPVDAMLLDGAYGTCDIDVCHEHLSLSAAETLIETAKVDGCLCGKGYAILTNTPPMPDATEKYAFSEKAKRAGFLLPYDGSFLEV